MEQAVAILTSGGDSQGMNAAIRAVVRTLLQSDYKCYLVREGYEGLISENPESMISEAKFFDVSGILQQGGTFIGSARCLKFKERKFRKQAAKNLLKFGITKLCVIGGDGSLTGADLLAREWPEFVKELSETPEKVENLQVVGMVGSIDNDFCGTDMTIGVDTALHRILEAVDSIHTTASSHQRVFVCEVMGRNCGYLALTSAMATSADYVFLPEIPPKNNWETGLKKQLEMGRKIGGKRTGIIIVAEGAIDRNGKSITPNDIKNLLKPEYDVRTTILGHVQRGGNTSAFDRILSTRMGHEAANVLMTKSDKNEAKVIIIKRNQVRSESLVDLVRDTKLAGEKLEQLKFDELVEMRGKSYKRNFDLFKRLNKVLSRKNPSLPKKRIGIMTCGAPCAGMNSALRTCVLYLLSETNDEFQYEPVIIKDGFEGLLEDRYEVAEAKTVVDINHLGGSVIGTNRTTPNSGNAHKYYRKLQEAGLDGLMIAGGFEGFQACHELSKAAQPGCNFKCIVIPITISCNVPGTDITIGSDTALNAIAQACDRIKISASGSRRRVFIVETMGRRCGYLATMAGLSCGADASYIFEEKITLKNIYENVERLKQKMSGPVKSGIVVRANGCNDNYDTDFFKKLYSEEGKGIFDCRSSILGYVQQGDIPSPFDRKNAVTLPARACDWMLRTDENEDDENGENEPNFTVIGVQETKIQITDVRELVKIADFENRIPKNSWWLNSIRPLCKTMAGHK